MHNLWVQNYIDEAFRTKDEEKDTQVVPDDDHGPPDIHITTPSISDEEILLGWTAKNLRPYDEGTSVDPEPAEEAVPREKWSKEFEFLTSCVGYAVGLGNFWRFPYLCYKHGGGVFMIPYTIMLITVGIPLFFLEAGLGQFTSRSVLSCWGFAPFFSGLGVAMVMLSSMAAIYYNVIISWAWYYFFMSFYYIDGKLPWMTCPKEASHKYCYHRVPDMNISECLTRNLTIGQSTGYCYDKREPVGFWDKDFITKKPHTARHLPAQDYLDYSALRTIESEGVDDLGKFNFKLAACLLLSWTIAYFCVFKGIKSSGKVSYFTVPFPYVVLIIFLIRGLTLEGSTAGIEYFMNPNMDKMNTIVIWQDATMQIFFSLGLSWGAVTCLASHNKFHHDILRDTLIVVLINTLSSLLAGFVTFSFIGHLASVLHVQISDLTKSGTLLLFVIFPEAIATLPFPPVWSVLFFLMLITLGLDSLFTQVETVAISIMDLKPMLYEQKPYVILGIVVIMYLIGLTMCTDGAAYVIEWLDHYTINWGVLAIALVELCAIAWVYVYPRIAQDLATMLGGTSWHCIPMEYMKILWMFFWLFATPFMVLSLLIITLVESKELQIEIKSGLYTYPAWCEKVAISFFALIVIVIFLPGIVRFYKAGQRSISDAVNKMFKPDMYWGPQNCEDRYLVSKYVKQYVVDPSLYDEIMKSSKFASKHSLSLPHLVRKSNSKRSYVSPLETIAEEEEEAPMPSPESPV